MMEDISLKKISFSWRFLHIKGLSFITVIIFFNNYVLNPIIQCDVVEYMYHN